MGSAPKPPTPPKPKPPVMEVAADPAAAAEGKFLKGRKGALSTWLTRGQTIGGGRSLQG